MLEFGSQSDAGFTTPAMTASLATSNQPPAPNSVSRSEQLGRTKGHLTGRSHFNGQSYQEDRQEEHEEEDRHQEDQEVGLQRQAAGLVLPARKRFASSAGLRHDTWCETSLQQRDRPAVMCPNRHFIAGLKLAPPDHVNNASQTCPGNVSLLKKSWCESRRLRQPGAS